MAITKNRDPFSTNMDVDDQWKLAEDFGNEKSLFEDIQPNKSPRSKARKAITAIGTTATEVLKGVSTASLNELKREVTENMPNTANVADQAMGVVNEFSNVKQELLRNGASLAASTKQLWRNLSPKLDKLVPEKLRKKLDSYAVEEPQVRTKSKEEQRKDLINSSIERALKIQIDQTKAEDDERRINTTIDRKLGEVRHKDTIATLRGILQETEYHTEFYKSRMTGYMKEALTVQYSQLFVQKDILATMQVMSKNFDIKLESIVKNTGLPDFVKAYKSELFKKSVSENIMQKFSSKASNMISGFAGRFTKSIKDKLVGGMNDLGGMLDQLNMGLEMENVAKEMGADTGGGIAGNLGKLGVNLTSGGIASYFLKKMGPKTRRRVIDFLKNNPEKKFSNLSAQALTSVKHEQLYGQKTPKNLKQYLGAVGKDIVLDSIDTGNIDKVTNTLAKEPFKPTPFDIATRQSIVEIIPRYLSEIHYEMQALRKGEDQATKMTYDERTRDLMSVDEYKTRRKKQMLGDMHKQGAKAYAGGVAILQAARIHHAQNATEKESAKYDVKKYQDNVEELMTNMAAANMKLKPEWIKEYADGWYDYDNPNYQEDFENRKRWIEDAFKGIKDSKGLAEMLSRAFFRPDGSKNDRVIRSFRERLFDLMGMDSFKEVLSGMQDNGKQYLFKDFFDEQDEKSDGDQVLNFHKVLTDNARNYKGRNYNRYLANAYSEQFNDLLDKGVSPNEIIDKLPKKLQDAIRKKISEQKLDRRFGDEKQFNEYRSFLTRGKNFLGEETWITDKDALLKHLGKGNRDTVSSNRLEELNNLTVNKKPGSFYDFIRRYSGIPTNNNYTSSSGAPNEIVVSATRGEHVLLKPVNSIIEILERCLCEECEKKKKEQKDNITISASSDNIKGLIDSLMQHASQSLGDYFTITKKDENKPNEAEDSSLTTLKSIESGIGTMIGQMEAMRQENKLLMAAQVDANRVIAGGAPSKESKGLWKAVGSIGGGLLKGTGYAIGGASKGMWSFAKAVAVPSIKAVGGIAKGIGFGVGGLGVGAGIGVYGLAKANVAMVKATGRGIVNVGKGIGWLLGRKGSGKGGNLNSEIADEDSIQDVYVHGKTDVAIRRDQFLQGVYSLDKDGKKHPVNSVKDITGPVYDATNDQQLISSEELVNGLFDAKGRKFGNLNRYIEQLQKSGPREKKKGFVGKLFGALGSGTLATGKWIGKNALAMPGSFTNSLMGMGFGAIKWGGQTVGRLAHRLLGLDKGAGGGVSPEILREFVTARLDKMIKLMEEGGLGGKQKVFGDTDNDGDREGSYEDYVQKRKEEKEKLERRRELEKSRKKEEEKEKDKDDDDSIFSKLLSFIPGGKKIKALLKNFGGKLGTLIFGLLKKLKGVKSIFALLGLLLGGKLLGGMKNGIMNLLGFGDGEGGDSSKASELTDGAGVLGAAGGLYLAKKAAGASKGVLLKGGAKAAGLLGASKLSKKLATKAADVAAVKPAAKIGSSAAASAGKIGGGTATELAATAGKSDGIIVKCLNWLKTKLPKSWGKYIDKLIKVLGRILPKISASALGKIVAKLVTGPVGWAIMVGDMVYEAGKAYLYPQELLGISEDISIDWSDKFLIGVSAAICEGIFLGFVPTIFLANLLGVDVKKYVKDYDGKMNGKLDDLDELAKQKKELNELKEQKVSQSQLPGQEPNQNLNQNQAGPSSATDQNRTKFFNRATASLNRYMDVNKTSGQSSTPAAAAPSSGPSADDKATASQYGDASGWEGHYKPGSFRFSDSGGSSTPAASSGGASGSAGTLNPAAAQGGSGPVSAPASLPSDGYKGGSVAKGQKQTLPYIPEVFAQELVQLRNHHPKNDKKFDLDGRAYRWQQNKNPGNVKGTKSQAARYLGTDNIGHLKFRSYSEGMCYWYNYMIRKYFSQGINTPRDILMIYAPPSENNTREYWKNITTWSGMQPDHPINIHDEGEFLRFAYCVFRKETGHIFETNEIKAVWDAAKKAGGQSTSNAGTSDASATASQYGGADVKPYQPGEAYKSSDSSGSSSGGSGTSAGSGSSGSSGTLGGGTSSPSSGAFLDRATNSYKNAVGKGANAGASGASMLTAGSAGSTSNSTPSSGSQSDAPQSGGQIDQAAAGGGGDLVKRAIEIAYKQANSGATYDQPKRMGPMNYDCSSFVGRAYKAAGAPLPNNAPSTHDNKEGMQAVYTSRGFQWIPCRPDDPKVRAQLLPGDILLAPGKHTEMYLGNNKIIGARNKHPAPRGIGLISYFNDGYRGVLRWKGGGGTPQPQSQPQSQSNAPADQYGGLNQQHYKPGSLQLNTTPKQSGGSTPSSSIPTPRGSTSSSSGATTPQPSKNNLQPPKPSTPNPANATGQNGGVAGANQVPGGNGKGVKFVRPTNSNVITSPFGPRNVPKGSKNHQGIDLRARKGDPIFATASGTVTRAGGDAWNTVVIEHPNGLCSVYMHMSKINVKVGQQVNAGDTIGASGGAGPEGPNTYTPHLHFGIARGKFAWRKSNWIDPEQFLKQNKIQVSRKGQPGNKDMAPLSDAGAIGSTGQEDSASALKDQMAQAGDQDAKKAVEASAMAGATAGGVVGAPDASQSTNTNNSGGTNMSSIPSGGGAGSATLTNMSNSNTGDTSSSPSSFMSAPSSASSGGNGSIDFTPLIEILRQANIYLETISKNTNGISDMAKNNAAVPMNPVAIDVQKNKQPEQSGPYGLNNDKVPTELVGRQGNTTSTLRVPKSPVLDTSIKPVINSSHFA